ncbi:[FeFe] hydrogenase H-cluster radical SAM maturase HydG [Acetohalobium arabaticum]|uniref:Iron-only hydrogenase maturation protein HydG n=1 Tax=Acetohalobium arabaticum (strain ATCC 49924 / DSM 5501 / Z-7288) TaxID=574087 RepID=D9QQF9_ACEAZ|nr:[FeFe] hydrogenase H-cluster radical SAM maturase HydG [Acetohalobium arabaticum]ADL12750.1 iron-only hydrogenase maturation protein HydG [Acetohalobium arabaticum DSM 5501]
MGSINPAEWAANVIKQDEIDRYLIDGDDFIDDNLIEQQLEEHRDPDPKWIREIIQKSLEIERLEPEETAALLNVEDEELLNEMKEAALEVKKKVYDNRVVTFAPLYCSNLCVNNCVYCGFRKDNTNETRKVLNMKKVKEEARNLVKMGHKRSIVVYGEHPASDADYIAESMEAIYDVKVETKHGYGSLRRVNINAAPMEIEDLKKLWDVGVGTYQVFQETYHHETYQKLHPSGPKSNYRWRLYALHRAMEAGIDDVAIGALFGLYDWKFEVMGLLYHAIDLERQFNGVGPHTISFPRLMEADGSPYTQNSKYKVEDEEFKKLITVLRLAVPYTGLIVTARETPEIRREAMQLGCTQTDASTRIGIGAYSEEYTEQEKKRQQFILGDTRDLDTVIKEFAEMGMITSFCTAGYRCGRTGDKIMNLLQEGVEGKFCKLNAVLTFREWLDDFASEETKKAGEKVIAQELEEIENDSFFTENNLLNEFKNYYERIKNGERDLYI